MALFFDRVTIDVNGNCVDGSLGTGNFAIPGKIRRDDDGVPIINAAISAFALEYKNPKEAVIGREELEVEVTSGGSRNGTVAARLNLRPASPNRDWLFTGTVTALVIAELEDGHR
ncbi:hypothetical protein ACFVT2_39515 [Streptomyces sp. NPDC058000]|uniref:hypothetical protein n=1 Tax=Streptomyces sp. NPDC058000 TaxID=3346299 RepID=UPI0036EFF662